ncbi:hypothetical protein JCM1841_006117 [Sporobolomyces salmonicolor]
MPLPAAFAGFDPTVALPHLRQRPSSPPPPRPSFSLAPGAFDHTLGTSDRAASHAAVPVQQLEQRTDGKSEGRSSDAVERAPEGIEVHPAATSIRHGSSATQPQLAMPCPPTSSLPLAPLRTPSPTPVPAPAHTPRATNMGHLSPAPTRHLLSPPPVTLALPSPPATMAVVVPSAPRASEGVDGVGLCGVIKLGGGEGLIQVGEVPQPEKGSQVAQETLVAAILHSLKENLQPGKPHSTLRSPTWENAAT